jgi:hypothetical protein
MTGLYPAGTREGFEQPGVNVEVGFVRGMDTPESRSSRPSMQKGITIDN